MFLIIVRLFGVDDGEMRKLTGVDPGRGASAAPGQPLNPANVPGLVLWMDAAKGVTAGDNGKISTWADQSGKAQDLSQPDPKWQPLLVERTLAGKPTVRFVGEQHAAQGVFRDGFKLEAVDGVTMITLVRQNSESTYACLLHFGPDNNIKGMSIGLNKFSAAMGPACEYGSDVHSSGSALPGTGFRLLSAVGDNTTKVQELFEDGQRVAHVEPHTTVIDAEGRFLVGGYRNGAGNCHSGACADLAELMVFNRALTATERAGVELYLRNKWGLASLSGNVSPLASQLPFAYYPSTGEIELAFDKSADILQEHLGGKFRPADAAAETAKESGLAWAAYTGDKLPDDPGKAVPEKKGVLAKGLDIPCSEFDPKKNTPYIIAGWIDVPKDGTYTFILRPQSASQLWIDGKLIADQSGSRDTWGTWNWRGAPVALAAGKHRLTLKGLAQPRRIEHKNIPFVYWSGPGFWRQAVPLERLSCSKSETFASSAVGSGESKPLPKQLETVDEVSFSIIDLKSGKAVNTGKLKLDAAGRGQKRFPVGNLPEGEYSVEYVIAGTPVRLPQTFIRAKFPWEGNKLGVGHEVIPPFTSVDVNGTSVKVVGREYRINSFGMMDSCVSMGRELLAAPMSAIAKADGKEVVWKPGKVKGAVTFPDTAEFTGSVAGETLSIRAKTIVEEDGCCRIEWKISPVSKPVQMDWLELVIPLKESEATLFGWSAQDSMRHHYWGAVPPAGKIEWDTEQGKAPGWVPAAWSKAAGPAPADGRIWDSTRNLHWTQGNRDPFACYVWIGSEERGLCWFADRPGQFASDQASPIQIVCREQGRVVLRVRVIQEPTLIEKPRTLVFGLQASPTKPLRPDWRTHQVPGGGGLPVVCWGGYYCSSKYPDNRDFAVVDQIMRMATEDKPGLEEEVKAKIKEIDGKRLWKDLKIFDNEEWNGGTLNWFISQARYKSCCAYVEEHAHQVRMPEWQIFQDEWSALEFNRFQGGEGNYGVIAPSYHDFAVYYQNEYMRRGVSLYYDNSMPRQERNPFVLDGERDTDAGQWGLRSYYKRTWKNLQRLERDKISPLPLDFTIHVTNCMVLPMHTWATNILDLEQPYRSGKPFPPDYTRAMTSGLHAGVISHGMYPLANYNDYRDKKTAEWTEDQALADWAMFQVHEVRGAFYADWRAEWKQWKSFRDALVKVGYGDQAAKVINYWRPEKPVSVQGSPDITWIAVIPPAGEKYPKGVLGAVLVQSYAEKGAKAKVTWQGAKALVDHKSKKVLGSGDNAEIDLPGRFGTSLLWALDDPAATVPQ